MPFSSYQGYTLSTRLITADVDLDHLDEVCLSGFFIEKLLFFWFFTPFLYRPFYEEITMQPTSKEQGVMPHLLDGGLST